eukprot:TRINITY_DN4215_c0_g1_i1.p4 TRINITY_DN4215_c0_g1~~TRINITY_DN4215_c0_g1_i1.p4  ORF type:complete len:169 (-),score=6.32 TRINITY_DN4215_c0_g1_i1:81-587(-)
MVRKLQVLTQLAILPHLLEQVGSTITELRQDYYRSRWKNKNNNLLSDIFQGGFVILPQTTNILAIWFSASPLGWKESTLLTREIFGRCQQERSLEGVSRQQKVTIKSSFFIVLKSLFSHLFVINYNWYMVIVIAIVVVVDDNNNDIDDNNNIIVQLCQQVVVEEFMSS